MTIEERINLQKNKEIPSRLKKASNGENEAIDNYIQSKIDIRNKLKEEQEKKEQMKLNKETEKKIIEDIKKQITKEIEDTFKK
jgi:hypothetical protein